MKKYAFPFTLAAVCFIGGYVTCYSKVKLVNHVREAQQELRPVSFARARLEAARLAANSKAFIPYGAEVVPLNPRVEGWNQGLIAPMLPPKRVAP